jgi:hypothetical protein
MKKLEAEGLLINPGMAILAISRESEPRSSGCFPQMNF